MHEEAFRPAIWSVNWAEAKLAELTRLNTATFGPDQIRFDIEGKPGSPEIKQMYARGPVGWPLDMFRLTVEGLMHGKNAFDQAAWAANNVLEPNSGTSRGKYFPWASDEAHCKSRLESRKDGFDARLHPAFLGFGYFDSKSAPSFEQGLVRELSSIANRKHDVGITVAALATPPSQTVTGPGFVRFPMFAQWDVEKGEILLAEWHESVADPKPTTPINIRPVFSEKLNDTIVGPIRALELYTREAKRVIETLHSVVQV